MAETAFPVAKGDHFHWFTPNIEMDLCGPATLAVAHALHTILNNSQEKFLFATLSGELTFSVEQGRYTLDFPVRKPAEAELSEIIYRALNIRPKCVLKSRDYVLV